MSDPTREPTPDKSEDSIDNADEVDGDGDSSSLEFSGYGKNQGSPGGKPSAAEQSLGRLDITVSGFPIPNSATGDRVHIPLRLSEFTPSEVSKPMQRFIPLINEFLKNTDVDDQDSLSDTEMRQLLNSREALSNAKNPQDALSDALHLARLYQHMRYIEEAKKAIDLSLGIDPENYYGNQIFRELERVHPVDLTSSSKVITSQESLTKANLRRRILSMTNGKVIVVGDLLIDELLEGRPERISREAPVLILEHMATQLIPGGAANTANNIAALGGRCHAMGVCGQDDYADKLKQLFDKAHITHDLIQDPTRPTTVKTRILSSSHSFKQQLLRIDRIAHKEISDQIAQQLIARLHAVAGEYKAIVLSDYRAGVITDAVIHACKSVAAEKKLFVIVDAQNDFARYQNVSLLTPNQPDVEGAVGYQIKTPEQLRQAGEELMLLTGAQSVLITRGAQGMVLFQQGEPIVELPPFNKREVFDVTGAGDTVVGTMALALVTGSTYLEAMALGNLAAGIVVTKPGTVVTSQKEMLENLDALKIPEV